MKGSLEVTAAVTVSVHFLISLRYNTRGFTPALIPASTQHCEAHEVQILLCAAQTIPAQAGNIPREHPCAISAAPGAGQGSQTSCPCDSQAEHNFFTDATN